MIKKIIASFLILCAFAGQSFAQDKVYVWEKDGTVTGFTVANIDSISFTAPFISNPNNTPPVITIQVVGNNVTGVITCSSDLMSATLYISGMTVSGWPIIDFGAGKPVSKIADKQYAIVITDLPAGNYSLKVTDKNGQQTAKNFTIEGGPTVQYETFTTIIGGSSSTYGSYLSVSKKEVYTSAQISPYNAVEIIFDGIQLRSPACSVYVYSSG